MIVSLSHKKGSAHQGFTLIELLLYISLAAILLSAVSFFLGVLLSARVKNQTIAEVEQQGTQVMQLITQTARNADNINSPAQGATAATLSLDAAGTANDPTIFDLSGSVLRVTEGAGSAVPLTSSRVVVSAVTFQNLSQSSTPGTIRIQFTLTHENPGARNEYDFTQTFIASATLRQP